MPLPASVPTGTVSGTWYTPSGNLAVGEIIFLLTNEIEIPDDADGVVIPIRHEVTVSAGQLNATLPAGFYNVLIRLSELYYKSKVVEIVAGQNLNLPDAVGVVPPEELLTPVRTVNGVGPDASGNIDVSVGGGAVSSVFGRTGAVVAQLGDYTKAQVGLGDVDNTSDANKPISTATQAALDLKADDTEITALDARLDELEINQQVFPLEVLGLVAANDDPANFRDNSAMGTNGWFVAIWVPAGRAITGCVVSVHAAGTIDAGGENGFAIYSAAGAQVGSTPSDNALFASQGIRTKALSTPIPAQPDGRVVYVELRREGWAVEPQYAFLQTANAGGLFDGGWPSGLRRSFIAGGTGHPASINPATHGSSSSGFMPFVGLY